LQKQVSILQHVVDKNGENAACSRYRAVN
jgi:hypothetical protein